MSTKPSKARPPRPGPRPGSKRAPSPSPDPARASAGKPARESARKQAGRATIDRAGKPPPAHPTPDLRERIVEASRSLLEEGGVAAFSMREVARRAGVTHQAPYHHFADREAILAALLVQGFDDLARRLSMPLDRGGDLGKVIRAVGEAYVGFALDHPGVFRMMFRPEWCDPARFPPAREAGSRAHAQLERLVARVQGEAALDPAMASLFWSVVHGLSGLLIDGPLGSAMPTDSDRRAHAREVLTYFTQAMVGLAAAHDSGGSLRRTGRFNPDEVTTR